MRANTRYIRFTPAQALDILTALAYVGYGGSLPQQPCTSIPPVDRSGVPPAAVGPFNTGGIAWPRPFTA